MENKFVRVWGFSFPVTAIAVKKHPGKQSIINKSWPLNLEEPPSQVPWNIEQKNYLFLGSPQSLLLLQELQMLTRDFHSKLYKVKE